MNCICQNLTTFTGYYSGDNIVIIDGLNETTYYVTNPNMSLMTGVVLGAVFVLLAVFVLVELGLDN